MKPTDIRVRDVSLGYEDFRYRTPIKFGGVALDRVTILNVDDDGRDRGGQGRPRGFGSMPLGNVWAWPSRALTYDQTLAAMKARRRAASPTSTATCRIAGHPIDITHALEPRVPAARPTRSRDVGLGRADPDAGHARRRQPVRRRPARRLRQGPRPELLPHLRPGVPRARPRPLPRRRSSPASTLDRYVLPEPKPRMPLYHLVGALDPLTDADVKQPVGDGLPETLGEWIASRRPDAPEDQAQRRRPRLGRGARRRRRPRSRRRCSDSAASTDVVLLARLQRAVPERRLPARVPDAAEGADAGRVRPRAVHRAADGPRPEGEPGERDARGGEAQAGGDRRIAGRPGEPAAGPRDGLHRRGVQGVQGADADAAAGGRGAEVRACSGACRT